MIDSCIAPRLVALNQPTSVRGRGQVLTQVSGGKVEMAGRPEHHSRQQVKHCQTQGVHSMACAELIAQEPDQEWATAQTNHINNEKQNGGGGRAHLQANQVVRSGQRIAKIDLV